MKTQFAFVLVFAIGCTSASTPAPSIRSAPVENEPGHSHERDKMLLADAGPHHAALTAHLSKDGNELDIFLETTDREPQPVAIEQSSISAKVTHARDALEWTLSFEPAPADERPRDEPKGKCSHFVAKAAWMKPEDLLTVTCEIEIAGKKRTVMWQEFTPRKFAHHDDSMKEPPAP